MLSSSFLFIDLFVFSLDIICAEIGRLGGGLNI